MSDMKIVNIQLPISPVFPSITGDSERVENARQAKSDTDKNLSAINEERKDIKSTLEEKEKELSKELSDAEKKIADAEQKAEKADKAEEVAAHLVSGTRDNSVEAGKEWSWYNDQWEQAKDNCDYIKKEHNALEERLTKEIKENRPEAGDLLKQLMEKGEEYSNARSAEFQAEQEASRAAAKYEEAAERVRLSEENFDTAQKNTATAYEELDRERSEKDQISKEIESTKKELSYIEELHAKAVKACDDADAELAAALAAETPDPGHGAHENSAEDGSDDPDDPDDPEFGVLTLEEFMNALHKAHDMTEDERSAYDDARNEFKADGTDDIGDDMGFEDVLRESEGIDDAFVNASIVPPRRGIRHASRGCLRTSVGTALIGSSLVRSLVFLHRRQGSRTLFAPPFQILP